MKAFHFLVLATALVLFSCVKPGPAASDEEEPLVFEFRIGYPTKAVKTDWEEGDIVYVFIKQVPSPSYIKLVYESGVWQHYLMSGADQVTGFGQSLNNTTIDMRAIYRPFDRGDAVENADNRYQFKSVQDGYYLTATISSYEVKDNKISVDFAMKLGEDESFVQFYVADNTATDNGYFLQTDAVAPYQLLGVNSDLSIYCNTPSIDYGLTGYAYKNGYIFSGTFVNDYAYGSNYYFALTKNGGDYPRVDYLVREKTLNKKAAIALPPMGDARWQAVGNAVTVDMGTTAGVWYTCNYWLDYPESPGETYSFTDAISWLDTEHALPSNVQLAALMGFTHFPMSLKGQKGNVIVSSTTSGFLFLPQPAYYWGIQTDQADHAYYLYSGNDVITAGNAVKDARHIRYVTANQ